MAPQPGMQRELVPWVVLQVEQSARLVERSARLVERSALLVERSALLAERSARLVEQREPSAVRSAQLVER